MKFSLSIVITLLLVVNISSNESWICSPDATLRCRDENQTCCPSIYSPSKYVCFDSPNGQCCPDSINFCPEGTVCNMIKLRCDVEDSQLNFLSFGSDSQAITEYTNPIEIRSDLKQIPSKTDTINFSLGFVKGLAVFSNLPEQHDCLESFITSRKIKEDIIEIYALIKDASIHSDFIELIKNVGWYAIDIYDIVTDAVSACEKWSLELVDTGKKILNLFKSYDYLDEFASHVLLNFQDLKQKAINGYDAIISRDYTTSGEALGDFVRFALLWDFKN